VYYKLHSENNSWDSEITTVHTFKIEGMVVDSTEGKSLILKAFN